MGKKREGEEWEPKKKNLKEKKGKRTKIDQIKKERKKVGYRCTGKHQAYAIYDYTSIICAIRHFYVSKLCGFQKEFLNIKRKPIVFETKNLIRIQK